LRLLLCSSDIDQYDFLFSWFIAISKDGQSIYGSPIQVFMATGGLQHIGILFKEVKKMLGFPYKNAHLTICPLFL